MALSTQLRLIILAAGVLLLVIIYLLGRRGEAPDEKLTAHDEAVRRVPKTFDDVAPAIDEDEYDEPSYLRRSGRRERTETIAIHNTDDEYISSLPSVYIEPPVAHETPAQSTSDEITTGTTATLRVPVLSMQDPDKTMPMKVDVVLPSTSNVEAVNQTVTATQPSVAAVRPQRQLIALRLAMSEQVSGEQLLAMFSAENLHHGKFNIFHRLQDDETVFSVAGMIEPGSFDLETMPSQYYPGITLFMLLPGPLPGAEAFEDMMSSAQRLAQLTSGVVQDESGVLLLESGIQRLRDKVIDFELSLQA